MKQICVIEDCSDIREGFGYCSKHYQRLKKYGDPNKLIGVAHIRHGMRWTSEYKIWLVMKDRCNNSKNKSYIRYGDRGIKVCERWQESFINFFEDMGKRPSLYHSIERKNNDGNYEPSNCVWATRTEQNSNKRNNILVPTSEGTIVLKKWCLNNNLDYANSKYKYHRGWSFDEILNNRRVNETARG